MKKTRKMVAVLLSTVVAIGGLTGCGGGGSSSTVQTNDKGEITELVDAVQPESGEYDPAGAAAYEYFSVQTNCYEGKDDLRIREVPQTNYILFNINEKPFDDVRVRQAFSLALNRKDIAAVVGTACEPATTFVGKNYKSKTDGTKWSDLQDELLEENLEKAKQLLADAGYPDGKGLPTITYTYPAMSYEANVAQVLQAEWKELGVDVKLEAMEYEVYVDERRSGKLQMARMQWYADYNDPTSWLKMYQTGNAQNDVNWSNADYDKLIEESDKNLDEASRQEQLLAAEKILVSDDTVICPLFSASNQDLIDPSLTGYYNDGLAYTFWYNAHIKEDTK